ncbi:MAG: class I SAM-dependent methyltransferase [Saprospiraceae bacterium]
MKDFWNNRYAKRKYAYGQAPNKFFKEILDRTIGDKILLPADGEGRNAVYAASKNWEVTAYDYSPEAKDKALKLANQNGVSINFQLKGHEDFDFTPATYDAVGLFYTHGTKEIKRNLHQEVISTLKKGGILMMEVFSKAQLLYNSGGPKNPDMLFSIAELYEDFEEQLNIDVAKQKVIKLDEGTFHQGEAEVIRLVAYKK